MTMSKYGRDACPICGRDIALTKAGRFRRHGKKNESWPPRGCTGTGRLAGLAGLAGKDKK